MKHKSFLSSLSLKKNKKKPRDSGDDNEGGKHPSKNTTGKNLYHRANSTHQKANSSGKQESPSSGSITKDSNSHNTNSAAALAPPQESGDMIQYSNQDTDDFFNDDAPPLHESTTTTTLPAADSSADKSTLLHHQENLKIPLKYATTITKRPKPVSAIDLDTKNHSLLAVGDHTFALRLFDFSRMDRYFEPYREMDDWIGSYKINEVKWNHDANLLLVVPDSKQPSMFGRDGSPRGTFKQGDPYLIEKSKTKGHTAAVKAAQWHPWKHSYCMTGSLDGTVRIWNSSGRFRAGSDHVIKVRSGKKNFDPVYSCAYNTRVGNILAAGTGEGSILLYPSHGSDINKPIGSYNQDGPRSTSAARRHRSSAFSMGGESSNSIISVCFSEDDHTLAARSLSNKLLIFDIRQFSKPVSVFDDLSCSFEENDVIFSPDDRYILTGTSVPTGATADGSLVVIDKATMQVVYNAPVEGVHGSVIRLLWRESINQLFVGTSEGEVVALHDKNLGSVNGILKPLAKGYKKRRITGHSHTEVILNPLDMGGGTSQKRKRNDEHQLVPKNKRSAGPGYGGELGTSQSERILKKLGVGNLSESELRENPRDAILKYAKEAEENPRYVSHAYKDTQPTNLLDYESAYQEHEKELAKDQHRIKEAEARARFSSAQPQKRRKTNQDGDT